MCVKTGFLDPVDQGSDLPAGDIAYFQFNRCQIIKLVADMGSCIERIGMNGHGFLCAGPGEIYTSGEAIINRISVSNFPVFP